MEIFDRQELLKYALTDYKDTFNFNEEEFKKDFLLFFTTRKMIRRFLLKGIINHKLLLNNIIICLNTFQINKTKTIFRTICNDKEFSCIKACLMFLNSYIEEENENVEHNRIIQDILNYMSIQYTEFSEKRND